MVIFSEESALSPANFHLLLHLLVLAVAPSMLKLNLLAPFTH